MGKHHKSWSQEEKLTIVQHYQVHGAAKTSKAFNVSSTNIYKWAAALAEGQAGDLLQDKDKEILRLQREIQAYKEIIAEKELSLRIKDALLKKSL